MTGHKLDLLEPAPEWHRQAQCKRRNPRIYDTENMRHRAQHPDYFVEARELCRGCSVLQQCADQALEVESVGVIRAGVPLTDYTEKNEELGRYAQLRHIRDTGEFPPLPEPQRYDKASDVFEGLPPMESTKKFWFDGQWYVTRNGAAKLLGIGPRTMDDRRRAGKYKLVPRFIRRHETHGQGGMYYEVEQIIELKKHLRANRIPLPKMRRSRRHDRAKASV